MACWITSPWLICWSGAGGVETITASDNRELTADCIKRVMCFYEFYRNFIHNLVKES